METAKKLEELMKAPDIETFYAMSDNIPGLKVARQIQSKLCQCGEEHCFFNSITTLFQQVPGTRLDHIAMIVEDWATISGSVETDIKRMEQEFVKKSDDWLAMMVQVITREQVKKLLYRDINTPVKYYIMDETGSPYFLTLEAGEPIPKDLEERLKNTLRSN